MENKIRVLLVEDSVTARQVVDRMLQADRQAAFALHSCDNLTDALEHIRHKAVDIVILDLTLPESTGVETVTRVREVDRDVPVVVFTGCDDENLAMAAMHLGADDFLVKKEVRQGSLLTRTLRYAVEKKRARNALDRYAMEMERLAEARARQLLHHDRLATIGTMSAGVAHEVRSPLAFIASNVKTLESYWPQVSGCLDVCRQQGLGDVEDLEYLRDEIPVMLAEIRTGVDRIVEISDGLKNFARKSSGDPIPADLETLIDHALLLCKNLLKYGIEVKKEFGLNGLAIPLQPQKMVQIFVNLFNNAAQAMDGKGALTVTTSLVEGQVVATVGDSGPGIPDEVLDSIWDPFFTTKPEDLGTGLGLSICKEIAEAHGGAISAQNDLAGGARFTLSLPVAAAGPSGVAPATSDQHGNALLPA